MNDPLPPPSLWKGQWLHALGLIPLLILSGLLWQQLGRPFPVLFWIAIAIPIVHQVYVWVAWRLELNHTTISESMGIRTYLILFFILLISRVIIIFALGWADAESLGMAVLPRVICTILLAIPAIYLGYSVKKYFGFVRAAGADHFDQEYREMPLVKEGIFRITNNGMYHFGFLLFWALSIGFDSAAALLATAFAHVYIWIHFYATEKPDMQYLYGQPTGEDTAPENQIG